MKKIIICLSALVMTGATLKAQGDWPMKNIMLLNWEVGIPMNSNYLTKTSYRGGNFGYRHFINPKFSIGGALHWNSFEEYREPTVYEKPDGSTALYTDMVRQVYTVPMELNGHYYLDAGSNFRPYVGLGLGAQYSEQSAYYNIFVSEEKNWGFLVRPEVGTFYKFNSSTGLHLSAGYNYATNENPDFKTNDLKHLSLSLGLYWRLY
jgi:outer membrane protein W